ncbi:MAG: hypothetical protein OQL19_07090 [Gammaproteobacteria bacterium]|nr:hypothetical protein [Gammaproteobacteria bacterium]
MDDPNEGLGHVLGFLESFSYSFDIGTQEIAEHHESVKGRNYITSWTMEPDLMAMWLLYSKSNDSIRVRTSLEKLELATKDYFEKNFSTNHIDSPEGTLQLDSYPYVKPVKYVSFESLSDEIKDKYKKYLEICVEFAGTDSIGEQLRKLEETRLIDVFESGYLKDESYSHEKEIRANISICTRNSVTKEELEEQKKQGTMSYVMGTATHGYPPSSELPEIINIPIPSNFVEAVCFDPRAPEYVKKEQETILLHVFPNITIEESKAFGYKPNHHVFSIEN